ncbi:MAG TPA: c-type cytochrome [Candidatus Limnocylindrales bacterium]|nr:c-type cytochrome [Candidatus Limnocylindrales bacterium]
MKSFLFGIIFTLIVLILGASVYSKMGYLDTRADISPPAIEKHVAMEVVDASTERHAPEMKNPIAPTEPILVEGAKLYMNHCAGCHGIPSNADSQFGRSFYPPVPQFFTDAPDMPDNQNFYITKHGIRWTGMPAWGKTLSDTQIWTVTAFLANIEKLPPSAKKELEVNPPAAGPPEAPQPSR